MSESLETKKKLVERMITSQYWLPENRELFSGDFSIELPMAPPGMPQNFNPVDTLLYMEWLSRTVKTWQVKPEYEIYETKNNENLFWAVRECSGDVHWGGVDGKFESRMVSKITLEKGKIKHMKEWSNPLKFLKAIGAKVPIFRIELDFDEVKRFKEAMSKEKKPAVVLDNSPKAVAKRLADNLAVYRGDIPRDMLLRAEDCERRVFFVPPDMKEAYYGDDLIAFDIWLQRSMISLRFVPGAEYYETDVPNAYFIECGSDLMAEWQGNNVRGAYRNRYVMFMVFENGVQKVVHEYLNPINKFNSINKSIPSFPYYF